MRIIITGTPGVGKTSVARILAKKLGLKYVGGKRLIEKFSEGYDNRLDAFIVDEKKLARELAKEDNVVVDSHLSHFASPKKVDLCVVLRCETGELIKRLEKRRYNAEKIRENVQAEIMNVCGSEAFERKHLILEINTTGKTLEQVASIVIEKIDFLYSKQ